jgi:hypothetical protein
MLNDPSLDCTVSALFLQGIIAFYQCWSGDLSLFVFRQLCLAEKALACVW